MAPIWDNNKPHGAFDKWWMLQYAGSLKTSPHLRLTHSLGSLQNAKKPVGACVFFSKSIAGRAFPWQVAYLGT